MTTLQYKKNTAYLTKNEELELGVLIQNGIQAKNQLINATDSDEIAQLEKIIALGSKAKDKLVTANLGLVFNQAKKFKQNFPAGPELDDIIQYGMCGLMVAADKYDPKRNNKFSTVAYAWIMQAIGRETNSNGRLVRLPENRINDFTRINLVVEKYKDSGLTASQIDEKVCIETGLTPVEISNIRNAAGSAVSLNKKVSNDESGSELMHVIGEVFSDESAEDIVMKTEVNSILTKVINGFPPVYKAVLSASFNIETSLNMSFTKPKQVRDEFRISNNKYKAIYEDILLEFNKEFATAGLDFNDLVN